MAVASTDSGSESSNGKVLKKEQSLKLKQVQHSNNESGIQLSDSGSGPGYACPPAPIPAGAILQYNCSGKQDGCQRRLLSGFSFVQRDAVFSENPSV